MLTHWERVSSAEGLAFSGNMAVWLRSVWYPFKAKVCKRKTLWRQIYSRLSRAFVQQKTQGMRMTLAYWRQLDQLRRQLDLQGLIGHTYPRLGLKESTEARPICCALSCPRVADEFSFAGKRSEGHYVPIANRRETLGSQHCVSVTLFAARRGTSRLPHVAGTLQKVRKKK